MADEDLAARVTALEETVGLVPTGDATGAAGADAGGGSAEGAAGDDGSAELRAENEALKEKVAKLEYRVKFLMRSLMAAEAAAAPAGAGVRASDIDVGVSGVSVPPVDDEVVAWAVAEMKARLANAANARTSEALAVLESGTSSEEEKRAAMTAVFGDYSTLKLIATSADRVIGV